MKTIRLNAAFAGIVLLAAVLALVAFTAPIRSSAGATASAVAKQGPTAPGAIFNVEATAYCVDGTTKSGIEVRRGIAAADPELIPLGSVIEVSDVGDGHDGVYMVLDTGAKVKGKIIDIYVEECDEAVEFGRRDATVRIIRLGWDPEAS
jgi:3D (Asp-Asp-Asp) domain-containing protein